MSDLTARHAEIERLFIAGMSYDRIASELRITRSTVSGVCYRAGLTADERMLPRDQRIAKVKLRSLRVRIAAVERHLCALRAEEQKLVGTL